jgi:hypothetical protein
MTSLDNISTRVHLVAGRMMAHRPAAVPEAGPRCLGCGQVVRDGGPRCLSCVLAEVERDLAEPWRRWAAAGPG